MSVKAHIINFSTLLALTLILALCLYASDVEASARHNCHILRGQYLIIVIVLVSTLVLRTHALLLLLSICLQSDALSVIGTTIRLFRVGAQICDAVQNVRLFRLLTLVIKNRLLLLALGIRVLAYRRILKVHDLHIILIDWVNVFPFLVLSAEM